MPTRYEAGLRHALYYAENLHQAEALYMKGGLHLDEGLDRFDMERPNITAAQDWLTKNMETSEDATALCAVFVDAGAYLFHLRIPSTERIRWRETALRAAQILEAREVEGVHLGSIATAYHDMGNVRKAIPYYEQYLAIAREMVIVLVKAGVLGNMGNAYYDLGDNRRAAELHQQHVEIAREVGDRRGEANALGNLGNALMALGKIDEASRSLEKARTIFLEIGDRVGESHVLGNLGSLFYLLGQFQQALEVHLRALDLDREINDRVGESADLDNLGTVYKALGDIYQAEAYYQADVKLCLKLATGRSGQALGNLVTSIVILKSFKMRSTTPPGIAHFEKQEMSVVFPSHKDIWARHW
jgi:tetratricopeptide (TPR) repeat protein